MSRSLRLPDRVRTVLRGLASADPPRIPSLSVPPPIAARLFGIGLSACATAWPVSPAVAQEPDQALNVASVVADLVAPWDGDGPGGAIAVVIGNRIAHERGFGLADLERAVPFTPGTIFEAASMSKHFTALAVRSLERDGVLASSDPIGRYWPELPSGFDDVTLAMLLAHTAGVPNPGQLLNIAGLTWHDVMVQAQARRALLRSSTTLFPPGSSFSYSNGGYIMLAEVVDRSTPGGLAGWLRRSVFEPLGMNDTHVHTDYGHAEAARAVGYRQRDGVYRLSPDNTVSYGAGGIRTTIHDLAMWLSTFGSGRWLPGTREAWRAREGTARDGARVGYADGMFLEQLGDRLLVGHAGRDGSFVSYLGYLPELGAGAVVVSNGFPNDPQLDPRALILQLLERIVAASDTSPGATAAPPDPGPAADGPQPGTDDEGGGHATPATEIPGTYWHPQQNYLRWIVNRDGRLFYRRTDGTESPLLAENGGWRMGEVQSDIRLSFETVAADSIVMRLSVDGGPPSEYLRVPPYQPGPVALDSLTGVYLEPSLLIALRIRRDGDRLAIDHPIHGTEHLVPTRAHTYNIAAPYWSECNDTGCWLGVVRFTRSAGDTMELRLQSDGSDLVLRRVGPGPSGSDPNP